MGVWGWGGTRWLRQDFTDFTKVDCRQLRTFGTKDRVMQGTSLQLVNVVCVFYRSALVHGRSMFLRCFDRSVEVRLEQCGNFSSFPRGKDAQSVDQESSADSRCLPSSLKTRDAL